LVSPLSWIDSQITNRFDILIIILPINDKIKSKFIILPPILSSDSQYNNEKGGDGFENQRI
jgi:hypothetical protein